MRCNRENPATRPFWIVLWTTIAGIVLNSFLLYPLYRICESDVLLQGSWWCVLLGWISDAAVVDSLVFLLVYPATLYALYAVGPRASRRIPIAFALLTVLKFGVNYGMYWLIEGRFMGWHAPLLLDDLAIIGPMLLLELLQYGFAVLMAVVARRRARPESGGALPFRTLFSWRNPLQFASLWVSLYLFLARVASILIYALTQLWVGEPDRSVYFFADLVGALIYAVLFYFASILLLSLLGRADARDPAGKPGVTVRKE